jgi:four helix bundle protein
MEENPKYRGNKIVELTLDFALEAVKYCDTLEQHHKYVLARQLLKSATSIGASVREAQNAESKADFIHKMKLASKEVDETEYWLIICGRSQNHPSPHTLTTALAPIRKVLNKIIATSKKPFANSLIG